MLVKSLLTPTHETIVDIGLDNIFQVICPTSVEVLILPPPMNAGSTFR